MNFAKFLRTPFLTEHLWWLLLHKLKPHMLFKFYVFRFYVEKKFLLHEMLCVWEVQLVLFGSIVFKVLLTPQKPLFHLLLQPIFCRDLLKDKFFLKFFRLKM